MADQKAFLQAPLGLRVDSTPKCYLEGRGFYMVPYYTRWSCIHGIYSHGVSQSVTKRFGNRQSVLA